MLLGMIQFGIYQSTTNTLWNLSREGARFATVSNPSDAAIVDHIRQSAPPNVDMSKMAIAITPATRTSGQPVEVRLTYNMGDKIIFPFVGAFLGKDRTIPATPTNGETTVKEYNYSTVSTMRVE